MSKCLYAVVYQRMSKLFPWSRDVERVNTFLGGDGADKSVDCLPLRVLVVSAVDQVRVLANLVQSKFKNNYSLHVL